MSYDDGYDYDREEQYEEHDDWMDWSDDMLSDDEEEDRPFNEGRLDDD